MSNPNKPKAAYRTNTITNTNIGQYVKWYVNGQKNMLPSQLQTLPIGQWDVSGVTKMELVFNGLTTFNEPLDAWDVSNVKNMVSMFFGCKSFNKPLNSWNVSKVNDMSMMFYNCESFNQPLNSWNVSTVNDMSMMFKGCTSFNQSLKSWNVTGVLLFTDIFDKCGIDPNNKPIFGNTTAIPITAPLPSPAPAQPERRIPSKRKTAINVEETEGESKMLEPGDGEWSIVPNETVGESKDGSIGGKRGKSKKSKSSKKKSKKSRRNKRSRRLSRY